MKAKQNIGAETHDVAIFDGKTFATIGYAAVSLSEYLAIEAQALGARRIFSAECLGDANLERLGMDAGGDWRKPVCFGEYWN